MLSFLALVAFFAFKAAIVLLCLIILIAFVASLVGKDKDTADLSLKNINKKLSTNRLALQKKILNKKDFKNLMKSEKANDKNEINKKSLFVINFNGDIKASATEHLREEISAVILAAREGDQVMVNVESPGGMVHGYGLAASQLSRLKDHKIPLTICVDKIAASGGYMMACIANKIIAAPFAIIGSIGVIASMPNFNRVLKKVDVDYLEITAGEYKRTITPLGEITEKGINKFKEQIEDVHILFKNHVKKFRSQVELDKVATGEYWYGSQALELKLVDELKTSDEFLIEQLKDFNIIEVTFKTKKSLKDKLSEAISTQLESALLKIYQMIWNSRYN
jgi:serine protease SohB